MDAVSKWIERQRQLGLMRKRNTDSMIEHHHRWLTRQHVRMTMLLAHERCTTYFIVAAAMMLVVSLCLFWLNNPLTLVVSIASPLFGLFALINEGRSDYGDRFVATTEWLAAFIEVVGHQEAKLILERATKNASSARVFTSHDVLVAARQVRADQRRCADEARGLKSDDIDNFLSDQAQRRAKS